MATGFFPQVLQCAGMLSTLLYGWSGLNICFSFSNDNQTPTALSQSSITADQGEFMNKEQVSGKLDQAVGKVKQGVGEAVGNQELANKGVVDQATGAVKETWGDAKDAAKQIHVGNKKTAAEKADETRSKISQSVEDTKDKLKDKIEDFKDRHTA